MDKLFKYRSKIWRWGWIINYVILWIRVGFHIPFFSTYISGLAVTNYNLYYVLEAFLATETDISLDISIFAFLALQNRMFEIKDFEIAIEVRRQNKQKAIERTKKRYDDYVSQILVKKENMKETKRCKDKLEQIIQR